MKFNTFLCLMAFFFMSGMAFGQGRQYEVRSLSDQVNSPYDEQAPMFSPDGNTLYFTRAKHPENVGGRKDEGDIWIAQKTDSLTWSQPVKADTKLNNSQYNSVIGISDDGNTLYLAGHYEGDNKRSKTQGLSMSEKRDGVWSFPVPLDIPYFSNRSDHQSGCLSHNGSIIIHAIESYNGRGAEDLYVSFRKTDGSWTDALNLGSTINTAFQEKTPYLAPDNKTLMFSSNGYGGEGSMDLFISTRLDDTWKNWSQPVNLGAPLNTPGRELYYLMIPGTDQAIFCSTQNSDGYGDIKIYRVLPEEIIKPIEEAIVDKDTVLQEVIEIEKKLVVQGKIFDADNNLPLIADVILYNNQGNEIQAIQSDGSDGSFQFELDPLPGFQLRMAAKGYMNIEDNLSVNDSSENLVLLNYFLEPLVEGKVFKLNNVLFHRGTDLLLDSSYVELNNVVRMMKDNPDIEIELSGHTDNQGNARKNVILSQERVEKVKEYLVSKGIGENRITGKGYGGDRPIASNRMEETRRLNRRVEFTVIKSD